MSIKKKTIQKKKKKPKNFQLHIEKHQLQACLSDLSSALEWQQNLQTPWTDNKMASLGIWNLGFG